MGKEKPLEILVVEDNQKNLENAREAYNPLEKGGLIIPHYVTRYEDAEHLIRVVDAGILDLYFPAENPRRKLEEFADKYKVNKEFIEKVKIEGGLYPIGLYIADKLAEQNKPLIFVSTIASGHGDLDSDNRPFYELRDVIDTDKMNELIKNAWYACEAHYKEPAFISRILMSERDQGKFSEKFEKIPEVWLAALKAVAGSVGCETVYNKIHLEDKKIAIGPKLRRIEGKKEEGIIKEYWKK